MEEKDELCIIPVRRTMTFIKGGQKYQIKPGFPVKNIYPIIKDSMTINPFWLTLKSTDDPVSDTATHCLECKLLPEDEALQRTGCEYDSETNELSKIRPGFYINDDMNLVLEFRDPLEVDTKFVFDGYRILVKSGQTLQYKYL